jgi:hypothetical protein
MAMLGYPTNLPCNTGNQGISTTGYLSIFSKPRSPVTGGISEEEIIALDTGCTDLLHYRITA